MAYLVGFDVTIVGGFVVEDGADVTDAGLARTAAALLQQHDTPTLLHCVTSSYEVTNDISTMVLLSHNSYH